MRSEAFFHSNTVFNVSDAHLCLSSNKVEPQSNSNLYNLLAYHQKQGHILHIRRGLYYSVPKGIDPNHCPVDAFLIASKMSDDAVIAYATALDFHGHLHTVQNRFIYLTKQRVMAPFDFKGIKYQAVSIPSALKKSQQEMFGVQKKDRQGMDILVTSLERTLVDVLDRPYLCGSWEEIWLSLESIGYFDLDQVLQYALLLENATTIAKLGFFLETHREELMVPEHYLDEAL